MKKTLVFLLILTLAFSAIGCNSSRSSSSESSEQTNHSEKASDGQTNNQASPDLTEVQTSFQAFLDDIFKEYVTQDAFTLHSHLANPQAYGINKSDHTRLPSFTEEWFASLVKRDQISLKKLQEFDPADLTSSQAADYTFLENELTLSLKNNDEYASYKTYLGKDGCPSVLAVTLSQYYFQDEEDITNYFELLKEVPTYLDEFVDYELCRQENGMVPSSLLVEDTIEEINSFLSLEGEDNLLISSFAKRVDGLQGLNAKNKTTCLTENEQLISEIVLPAYQRLKNRLKLELKPSKKAGGLASYKKGKDYYAFLLRKNVGTDLSPDQCEEILSQLQQELLDKSRKLTKENEGLYDTLLGTLPSLTDPEKILEALHESCQDDFPALEIHCQLEELPDALSSTAASAFFVNPPLDLDDQNVIFFNKMRIHTSSLIPVLAHEGYPGHLYQTSYYKQSSSHPVRSLWPNAGFDEGWGTYAQLYGYQIMDFSNEEEETTQALRELYANNDLFSLCLCGLSDLYVNDQNYSMKDLAEWLSQYGITTDRAEEIYHYVLQQPTSYLTYIIGYHEIKQMLEEARQSEDFSFFNFHKGLLDHGSCPFYLINER